MITKAEPWGSAFVLSAAGFQLSAAFRHFERSEAESRNIPAKKFPAVMKDNGIMAGRKS
ncbi:hypothetical protein [uncultured Dialister sp.]|uniref:hypothetical protein n=1 Tax=uncultured Dialister sp. TaxID=278064 RepID=UPI0025F92345|nr:hypothetical protein [uncultured Dialister sp.]